MAWQDLILYWRAKHQGGKPPSRTQLDPITEIPKLLPNLFLLDVEGNSFRFRLVGSEITRRAGRDSTGRLIDRELLSEQSLRSWLRILRKVATAQVPVLYRFDPRARTTFNALGLLAPLVDAHGRTEMLIGGLFFGQAKEFIRPGVPDRVYEFPLPEDLYGDVGSPLDGSAESIPLN